MMTSYLPAVRTVRRLRPRGPRLARVLRTPMAATFALSIIVPVYNTPDDALEDNLGELAEYRHALDGGAELVLVDDGSRPSVAAILERFSRREPGTILLRNERNRGKGHAVHRGLAAAHGRHLVFIDADLAYPPSEIGSIVAALTAGNDVAIGCRVLPESRYLMSPAFFPYLYSRHVMSRAFNFLVGSTLIPGMLDSQAGLKGMTAAVAAEIVPRLAVDGFAFDVELLYAAHRRGFSIAQVPVFFRYDSEPTTMHFARDSVTMAGDLARVWWRGLRGRYG